MKDRRETLMLRLGAKTDAEREADNCSLLKQAVDHHLCVRWSYNGTTMMAVPRILYRKNRGLYLDAIVIERYGMSPAEPGLDSFRLTDLSHIVLTTEAFVPDATIDVAHVRYREGIIASAVS